MPSTPALINRDVEAAKSRYRSVNEAPDLVFMANVGLHEFSFGAELTQFSGQCVAGILFTTGNHDPVSRLCKGNRGRAADAGECTRDKNDWRRHGNHPNLMA